MPTGLSLKPFGVPLAFKPRSTLVKLAVETTSTRPFKWMTIVPGGGTAMTFGGYSELSRPAAALPDGVLAIPQALLLLLVAGPAPKGAANCPCDGFAGVWACASIAVPPK